MALIEKLEAIGDAIRAKTGGTDELTLDEMVDEIEGISGGGSAVIESKTITANGTYTAPEGVDGYSPVVVNVPTEVPWKVLGGNVSSLILSEYFSGNGRMFKDSVFLDYILKTIESTENISSIGGMFCNAVLPKTFNYVIPFTFNFKPNTKIGFGNQDFFPSQVGKLTMIFNTDNNILGTDNESIKIGFNANDLVEYPDVFTNITLNPTVTLSGPHSMKCLLSFPTDWIQNYLDNTTKYSKFDYAGNRFDEFYSIKDIIIPINHRAEWNSNKISCISKYFYNIRHFKWNTQNGIPYTVNWTNQVFDLTNYVGYTRGSAPNYLSTWASEFGNGYRITNDSTYNSYKNEPTAWTSLLAYSFYNHDSAVETINSLPDASAYIATAGGTNTIKFKGDSGSATDGGAINTLTAEEIAVATAKGWTVTMV